MVLVNILNILQYSCPSSGQLLGNPIITCQSSGMWSTATAECITPTPISGDENQPPLRVYLSSNTIPEDASIGAIVGTLNTIDGDTGQTYTYTWASGESDEFRIDEDDNTLRTKGLLVRDCSQTLVRGGLMRKKLS